MTNILDKILDTKAVEVSQAKSIKPINVIKNEIKHISTKGFIFNVRNISNAHSFNKIHRFYIWFMSINL